MLLNHAVIEMVADAVCLWCVFHCCFCCKINVHSQSMRSSGTAVLKHTWAAWPHWSLAFLAALVLPAMLDTDGAFGAGFGLGCALGVGADEELLDAAGATGSEP